MIKFKEYLSEAKQIGTIYHFTSANTLAVMYRNGMFIKTGRYNPSWVSFTRNYNLKKSENKNIPWGGARIAIDANKLSNNYKIRPFLDFNAGVNRVKHEENEEQVFPKEGQVYISLGNILKQIDILESEYKVLVYNFGKDILSNMISDLKIPVNVVSAFKPAK